MNTRLLITSLLTLALVTGCAGGPSSTDHFGMSPAAPSRSSPASHHPLEGATRSTAKQELDFNPAAVQAELAEQWITDAEQAPTENSNELLLRAAEVLLREGELDRADDIVSELIIPELLPGQAVRLALIRARVYRGHAEFQLALQQLADPLVQSAIVDAPLPRQLQYSQLRAGLFAMRGNHLAAAQERIYTDPLLSPAQQKQNREAIWNSLMQVPTDTLLEHFNSADNRDYLGWLELASIAKDNQGDIARQITQRDAWLQRWPHHPARADLPGGLDKLDKLVVERPEKIALLLPVSGRLAAYGKAIRDGFYAAYYAALSQGVQLPQVKQYDTEGADIAQLYQRAITDGNQMVVGPLSKDNLAALLDRHRNSMPVPTLALNRIPGQDFPHGLYQFGLNPEDEAEQIASIAATKGYRRAMIITPEGGWGGKVAQAFAENWEKLGGIVVATTTFDASKNNYSKRIRDVLQIDASLRRRNLLQQILGERPEFEPYRRTDVDFIFLVARPNEGRAINPLLAYHYAGDIPVYATSHIYRGTPSPDRDQDIEGVHFIDVPWILDDSTALRRVVSEALPDSENYQRMYALGVDSFSLHMRLGQLQNSQGGRVFGETGTLTLNSLGQIERKLSLAQIKNGRPVTVPMAERARLP